MYFRKIKILKKRLNNSIKLEFISKIVPIESMHFKKFKSVGRDIHLTNFIEMGVSYEVSSDTSDFIAFHSSTGMVVFSVGQQ